MNKCRKISRIVAAWGMLTLAISVLRAQQAGDDSYKNLSLTQLMDIDVTSVAKAAEPFSQAPAAISVVTSDEIRRDGATDIPEAFRLAGNLDVAQKSPHDWSISARGFNTALSNKLLVLMDGRTLYTPLFSGVFWDVQDYLLEDIDRIEVIAGPGGTLWGANAVNGVINISSKSSKDTQGGYIEAGAGSELENFFGAREGVTLAPNVYFRAYAKYFDEDSEELVNGKNARDGWRMGQGGFRADSYAVAGTTLTLQGDFYDGDENVTTGGQAWTMGDNILARWSRQFSPDASASLQVYYDWTHLSDPVPASAFEPFGFLTDELTTYDVDFQDGFRLAGINGILWGVGYRRTQDQVVNSPALGFLPTTLDQNLYSAFLQDEIRLGPTLALTAGTKLEHNDYTGGEVEPSARLKWDPATHHMVWAAVSRAVRTPSRVDRDIVETPILVGQPSYGDETLVAYELGYRAQITPELTGSVSGYYNDYNDIRSLTFTPRTILPLYFENGLAARTHGAELSAAWQVLPWWQIRGSLDLLREHVYVKPGGTDLNNALNETADPGHQSDIHSAMDLPAHLELDADIRWIGSRINNNNEAPAITPAYDELDLRLGWHATSRLEISITGQNLLHREHVEYGVIGPTLEEIGRNIYGKAAWHF